MVLEAYLENTISRVFKDLCYGTRMEAVSLEDPKHQAELVRLFNPLLAEIPKAIKNTAAYTVVEVPATATEHSYNSREFKNNGRVNIATLFDSMSLSFEQVTCITPPLIRANEYPLLKDEKYFPVCVYQLHTCKFPDIYQEANKEQRAQIGSPQYLVYVRENSTYTQYYLRDNSSGTNVGNLLGSTEHAKKFEILNIAKDIAYLPITDMNLDYRRLEFTAGVSEVASRISSTLDSIGDVIKTPLIISIDNSLIKSPHDVNTYVGDISKENSINIQSVGSGVLPGLLNTIEGLKNLITSTYGNDHSMNNLSNVKVGDDTLKELDKRDSHPIATFAITCANNLRSEIIEPTLDYLVRSEKYCTTILGEKLTPETTTLKQR